MAVMIRAATTLLAVRDDAVRQVLTEALHLVGRHVRRVGDGRELFWGYVLAPGPVDLVVCDTHPANSDMEVTLFGGLMAQATLSPDGSLVALSGNAHGTLNSGIEDFGSNGPSHAVGIHTNWLRAEDLYVIADQINTDQSVYLKVLVKPLINLIWIAAIIFVLGSLLAIWPDGTVLLRSFHSGEFLRSNESGYFPSKDYGRIGLRIVRVNSDRTAVVLERTWCQ